MSEEKTPKTTEKSNGGKYQGRGAGRGHGGRGHTGRGSSDRSKTRTLKDKNDLITLPEIDIDMQPVRLKPILFEWLNRHYPKVSSIIENQCYLIKTYPTEQRIKEQWALMQRGDISAVLGVEGVVFDDGTDHKDEINEYQFGEDADSDDESIESIGEASHASGRRPVPTPIPVIEMNKRLLEKTLQEELTSWNKEAEELTDQRKRAHDELWNRLSPGLKGAIAVFSEHQETKVKKDILKLYKMLLVCLTARGATDSRHRRLVTKGEYQRLIMFSDQSLDAFKEIFDDKLKQVKAAGVSIDDETAADDFLAKLNYRFDDFRDVQERTGRYEGAMYYGERPTTVDAMFRSAQTEMNILRRRNAAKQLRNPQAKKVGNKYGAAYTGIKGEKTEKLTEPKKGKCKKCSGNGHKSEECTSNDWSETICYGCGGVGHYKNKCPSVAEDGDKTPRNGKN